MKKRSKLIVKRETVRELKATELIGVAGAADETERNCVTVLAAELPVK